MQESKTNDAGSFFDLKDFGMFWAATPLKYWPPSGNPERAQVITDFGMGEKWGDRRQEIVFIGAGIDWPALKERLDACLVPAVAAMGPEDLPDYPDPFPAWRRVETAA